MNTFENTLNMLANKAGVSISHIKTPSHNRRGGCRASTAEEAATFAAMLSASGVEAESHSYKGMHFIFLA